MHDDYARRKQTVHFCLVSEVSVRGENSISAAQTFVYFKINIYTAQTFRRYLFHMPSCRVVN